MTCGQIYDTTPSSGSSKERALYISIRIKNKVNNLNLTDTDIVAI